jgi:tetratricopeptide (TPR) repeat protein
VIELASAPRENYYSYKPAIGPIIDLILFFFTRLQISALMVCTSAASLCAAEASHFSLDPNELYSMASERVGTGVAHSQATDITVFTDEEACVFDERGGSTRTYYLIYKVMTQKGADGWDNISMDWEPWHEVRPMMRARVVTPDHQPHELDPKTISDAPLKDSDSTLYSDARQTRAPLPAIAIGSVVEQEIVVRETAPLFHAGVSSGFMMARSSVPVRHSRLTLDAPAGLPLKYVTRLLPDMKPERIEEGGRLKLLFDSGPWPGFEPAENYLPSDVAYLPEVLYSTGASWQQVAEEYSAIVDAHSNEPDLKKLADKVSEGKRSESAKARAIVEYLNREVRYTGIEFGDAAIVPHAPSETLARKYGDCKDKATLLVAVLRAAGIPAYVALLNVGRRMNVPSELPGMGMFDHAIAYIPPTGTSPAIWVDATDEYSRFGELPAGDQARMALIARAGTTGLVATPEAQSSSNVLREKRDFYLAENGKARVVETATPQGCFESEYRGYYADKDNKKLHEGLTSYMKDQYLAEGLDRMDRTEPSDFSKPFELVLESKKAMRGLTDLEIAVAAIRLSGLFDHLPNELKTKEAPEDKSNPKLTKPRTADYQLPEAFAVEWFYKIVTPAGFEPKPLPKDATISLGPTVLIEKFTQDADHTVHATIRFDSVKRRFTIGEATEMRNKISELLGEEAILINFEPTGQVLLNQGKVKEALISYRSLIAQHPAEAVHHLRLANVLSAAGVGEAARREARTAVKLEPGSAVAQKTLAGILENDLIGRRFRTGSDYEGAAAAYRAAIKLDPEDKQTVVDLAYLLEYNDEGVRYGTGAKLKASAEEYARLTAEELARLGFQNNRPFVLFYCGEYAEARKAAETLNPVPKALIVAAEAGINGGAAGIAEANKISGEDTEFKAIASTAGGMLMNARKYPQAADLLQVGASGDRTAAVGGLVPILRRTKLHEQFVIPNDPVGAVDRLLFFTFDAHPTQDTLKALASRSAQAVMRRFDKEEMEDLLATGTESRRSSIQSGVAPDVGLDLSLSGTDVKTEGDDAAGYRETAQTFGHKMVMFVVKEDGGYKLLDSVDKPDAVALEVLDRIAAHDFPGARKLLDWVRDDEHIEGGDDPFAGVAFPRLWTKGREASQEQMQVAAAAILANSEHTAAQGVEILEKAAPETTEIDLALLAGYAHVENFAKVLAIGLKLNAIHPDSKTVFVAESMALRGMGRFDEANHLAQERLKALPDDLDAARALRLTATNRGDYHAAYELMHKVDESGKAEAMDLNGMAWETLFFEREGGPDIDAALRASRMSQNSPPLLHTLGCLYAEVGRTKEAREVLMQGMDLLHLDEPNGPYWYAFGRIAEQFGEVDVAREDYRKVRKPKLKEQIPDSTYQLAQNRLAKL